ncbi:hypothetical protein AX17_001249 [Amanita inopinata Kibby_2008]|nr:hypothetical protein AX17_001249 [Amanita inopinata Kibby_2008]
MTPTFDTSSSLKYLGLPEDYDPSPQNAPIVFLTKHLSHLPPHILQHFSQITSAKQRTVIPAIRNRRLKYTSTMPDELGFELAKKRWPHMWTGGGREEIEESRDEKEWVNHGFLKGHQQYVGKLGDLLGGYEEEREAERMRKLRRQRNIIMEDFVPEEDESSEDESTTRDEETDEEARESFERLDINYDRVDWDESLDSEDDREAEERWFDEEEET